MRDLSSSKLFAFIRVHSRFQLRIFLVQLMVTAGVPFWCARAEPLFEIRDLGTLGGGNSRAFAINDNGEVVGEAETARGRVHAFLWTEEKGMLDLGGLGGKTSRAQDINNDGLVVGEAVLADGRVVPFIWSSESGMTNLPLPEKSPGGWASAINGQGVIAGACENSEMMHGAVWSNQACAPVIPEGCAVGALYDINDAGLWAGQATKTNEEGGAYCELATALDGTSTPWERLKEGRRGSARAMNTLGQMAGMYEVAESITHAFLYDPGSGFLDLDTLNNRFSCAFGLNDASQVVGVKFGGSSDDDHAFLYENREMIDLNDLLVTEQNWLLVEGWDINNRGEIVGYGLVNGCERAFLLTPMEEEAELPKISLTIPEEGLASTGSLLVLEAQVSASAGIKYVQFYVDGQLIAATQQPPFKVEWLRPPGLNEADFHARVVDKKGFSRKSSRVHGVFP